MIRGLYTATSGMIALQRKQEAISNNIANMNTPGYKQSDTELRSFPKMMIELARDSQYRFNTNKPVLGTFNTGVLAEENTLRFNQGDLQETNNPFDFALVDRMEVDGVSIGENDIARDSANTVIHRPKAFFTVMDNNGQIRYTRAGKFMFNDTGELVTPEGDRVMGTDGQPIVVANQSKVQVTKNGLFLQSETGFPLLDANNRPLAGMLISKIDNPDKLIPIGNNKYRFDGDPTTVPAVQQTDAVEIQQGFIERSNVDATKAMVDMVTVARAYEANQKVIQTIDKSMEKTANDIGRV